MPDQSAIPSYGFQPAFLFVKNGLTSNCIWEQGFAPQHSIIAQQVLLRTDRDPMSPYRLDPTLQTAMSHGLWAHEYCSMKPETERGSTTHLGVFIGHFQASGLCFEWPGVYGLPDTEREEKSSKNSRCSC